jgi:proteasome lid subunit RPN8/RPN11
MLRIPQKIHDEMIDHAREGLPLEVCGVLGGANGIVTDIYPITNLDASPCHFLMDPREQSVVFEELARLGLEIAAFYHSHPSGPEYPSPEDIRLAFYPDVPSLIVSLANPEKPVLNAFNIRNGNIESLFLKIVPDKTLQYQ